MKFSLTFMSLIAGAAALLRPSIASKLVIALIVGAWSSSNSLAQVPPSAPGTQSVASGGDAVIVSFDHGKARAPIATGPLWNGSKPPPTSASPPAGMVVQRQPRTRSLPMVPSGTVGPSSKRVKQKSASSAKKANAATPPPRAFQHKLKPRAQPSSRAE